MTVTIRLFALLKDIKGIDHLHVEIETGETVGNLYDKVFADDRAKAAKTSMMFAVNQNYATTDQPLNDGDEVAFIPPVSGGVDAPLIALVDTPIDLNQLILAVSDDRHGAIATFQGIVRNHAEGRSVERLEYEAYAGMAESQMREVAREIHEKWGTTAVAIVHRVGALEIGDMAVAVAVGTAHRDAAFKACRYAIDRLKQTVPIWKKEFYTDDDAKWK